jgi:hypothetical protein
VLVLERADPLLVNVERHDAQILFDEGVDKGFSIPPAVPVTMATFPAIPG